MANGTPISLLLFFFPVDFRVSLSLSLQHAYVESLAKMRWTAENENIVCLSYRTGNPSYPTNSASVPPQLWRTVFQTHTLHLELDKVSEAWRELILPPSFLLLFFIFIFLKEKQPRLTHYLSTAGDEKPTPKAIKEKLDKYRRNNTTNNVTFSMGKNPSTPSPRKTRARKPTAPASSPTPDSSKASIPRSAAKNGSAAVPDAGPAGGGSTLGDSTRAAAARNGTGTGTGRGRGRPRKTSVKDEDSTVAAAKDRADAAEPVSKKVKTEGASSPSPAAAAAFEIQIPAFRLSMRDEVNIPPDMKISNGVST